MAKEFKRNTSKDSKERKSAPPKKGKPAKRDDKPSFDRYRDDSRPSELGSPKRKASGYDSGRKPAGGRSYRTSESEEKYTPSEKGYKSRERGDKPFRSRDEEKEPKKERSSFREREEKPARGGSSKFAEKKPFNRSQDRPFKRSATSDQPKKREANPYDMDESDLEYGKEKPAIKRDARDFKKKPYEKKSFGKGRKSPAESVRKNPEEGIRLNKYIANAGICSRREADDLIASGVVQVNGKTITEMGFRVKPTDIIKYGGQTLKKERMVYLILNKPKDYITTVDDPEKRRTVLELVQDACRERIYPVGRLDRATTGLLMFTNDGELTKKLTHPRYGVRKIYHVELDKPLKRADMDKIAEGIELEDGEIKVDEISYVGDASDKREVGVEIHSGKNRVVRRIFESLGYNVRKLDRVMFGPLTKKDMPRGRWRFLTEAEVGMLKMIGNE
jgi:23S rRNA pseudouridine2605 synthase